MRELSAKLTEGEIDTLLRFMASCCARVSPSVKTFGFATSLIRGRLWALVQDRPLPEERPTRRNAQAPSDAAHSDPLQRKGSL